MALGQELLLFFPILSTSKDDLYPQSHPQAVLACTSCQSMSRSPNVASEAASGGWGVSLQVRVSAGVDPSTGERLVLVQSVPIDKPGNERSERAAMIQAEKVRTR